MYGDLRENTLLVHKYWRTIHFWGDTRISLIL